MLAQQLIQFRQTHPLYSLETPQTVWQYYRSGTGDSAILLFPSLGGDAETLFPYITQLEQDFVVIAPNLPPQMRALDHLLDGCMALLEAEQLARGHVVGLSFGGTLAQVFVRRFPYWVDDLVLTHTMIPNETTAARVKMQAALARWYPAALLRWFAQRAMQQALQTLPAEREFWQNYYTEYYAARWTRAQWLARSRWSVEYYHRPPFNPKDLQHWKGRVLIIESERDEVWDEGERGALQAMYPGAYVQTLAEASHLATLYDAAALARSIHRFLLVGSK